MLKILGGENIEFLTGGIFTQIQLHFLLRLEFKIDKTKSSRENINSLPNGK